MPAGGWYICSIIPHAIFPRSSPKPYAFTSANVERIPALQPDLVLGFSDLQADIAAQTIGNPRTHPPLSTSTLRDTPHPSKPGCHLPAGVKFLAPGCLSPIPNMG